MYNGIKVLDVHGHVSVPWGANAALMLLMGSNTATSAPYLKIGKGLPPNFKLTDDDFRQAALEHCEVMDARNIDVQIIGPRPFFELGWMQDHLVESWAREVNEQIYQQVSYHPDRFLGACQLPLVSQYESTANVLPELRRCVDEYGFVAAYITPDPGGERNTPGVHEPYWYPLYEECEGRNIPIIVHGSNVLDRRLRIIPQNYQVGFYVEQFIATALYGHSDVFDRFPGLKIMVCHCGGGLDRFVKTDPHLPSRDTSPNLFFDTNAYETNYLTAAIRQRGVDQMCFGTEAPGSGWNPRPENGAPSDDLVPVISGMDWLSDEDKIKIFHNNPIRVFPQLTAM